MNNVILYEKKEKCCGCGTCRLVCPKQAITMETDPNGFLYPVIEKSLCVGCGLCQKVCAFQRETESNKPQKVYALSLKNADALQKSASGGVFGGLANQWIKEGGIVFGAALILEKGHLVPQHCLAKTEEELQEQLGSKYVQSDLRNTFVEAKSFLEKGEKVLYSGTPCQIAGLKSYLGKDYENLLTMDLVCHGVPSATMFQEYLKVEEDRLGGSIENFKFRDKECGWGKTARICYHSGIKRESCVLPSYKSSYYELFLGSDICRENCYHCPYANEHHPADLTIGDFWGIEEEHPEYLQPKGNLNLSAGISMLMINTLKGAAVFEVNKDLFWHYPSTFANAAKYNEQLKHPSVSGTHREKVLMMYRKKGYKTVDEWFWKAKRKECRNEKIKYHIHNGIPGPVRKIVKKILRRDASCQH